MSTSFGERLLGEVHQEGLHELLRDLRDLVPRVEDVSRLGVHDLDALLGVFMPSPVLPALSQAQRKPQDLEQEMISEDIDEHGDQHQKMDVDETRTVSAGAYRLPVPARVKRGDPVIEVSSTSSAAGKTQLLYYLTAVAVLPSTYNGIRLDGRDSAVVFIDTDGRFDPQRLRTIALGVINRRLKNHGNQIPQDVAQAETNPSTPTPEQLETIVRTSLQHVHVFRPQSSSSLLATLQNLDTYLLDTPRHLSAPRPLHAIFIDSATAFFWQDKLHDEVARTENIGRPAADLELARDQKRIFSLADVYARLVLELKRLQTRFSCSVAYTCTASGGRSIPDPQRYAQQAHKPSGPFDPYHPPGNTASSVLAFRCPLPPPWGGFPTLRLIVRRDAVRPFPPMATVGDARREAALRQKVVLQGRFVGRVNEWGREDWPRRIIEELRERSQGVFKFHVGRNGIEFA